MKKLYNTVTTTLLLSAITGLASLAVLQADNIIIKATLGPVAIVSAVLTLASVGSFYNLLNKPYKDITWMKSTIFENVVRRHNPDVLVIQYGSRVVQISIEDLYARLKSDYNQSKHNRVCNRDTWRSFGYNDEEIIAIKKYLLTNSLASGQLTGAIKLNDKPSIAIDKIRGLNSN